MEEREQILSEARKHVPGVDGRPTMQPHLVEEGFPSMRPNWDFECAEGRRNWTLGTLQPRVTGHSRRTREGSKRMEVNTASLQSLEIEVCPTADLGRITLTLLIMAVLLDPGTASTDPHQPVKITWRLQNGLMREILNTTTETPPPNT